MSSTNHAAPHYVTTLTPLLSAPSQAQVSSSIICSQTTSSCVPPVMSDIQGVPTRVQHLIL